MKNDEKYFWSWWIIQFLEKKTLENVMKHKDIRLLTPERRVYYLVSEPNFYTTKFFTENLLAIKKKNWIT